MSTMDPILIGDDAGPKIAGTIWALVGISGIFLALRLYVKAIIHRHIWWDDSFLIASWVSDKRQLREDGAIPPMSANTATRSC